MIHKKTTKSLIINSFYLYNFTYNTTIMSLLPCHTTYMYYYFKQKVPIKSYNILYHRHLCFYDKLGTQIAL